MNEPHITEYQLRHADKLVSWTLGERLRFAWYRNRLTIGEMNYAIRRMTEVQMRLPGGEADPDARRAEVDKIQQRLLRPRPIGLGGNGNNARCPHGAARPPRRGLPLGGVSELMVTGADGY